jgi:hypothetical protein
LQFDQSAKLDQITAALGHLKQRVEQVRHQNPAGAAAVGEIESLEQQISKLSLSQEGVAEEQAILKSLSFKTQPVRHTSIPEAHQKTFGWVYQSGGNTPTVATYVAKWLRRSDGPFWVSGKPGSGKSTFMKFIANEPKTLGLLSEWSGSKQIIIASHYFWSAGTAMQKSQQGLLRTLLYEIFRQCSEFIAPVCGNRRPAPGEESEDGFLLWTLSDLHAMLRKVATRETASVRFCFFIDGLDEYDGDHYELCEVLKDLVKSANIKICLSSRPWNVFEEAFGEDPQSKLYIHDLTRNDILEYIRCRLYEHRRWPSLATKASQGDWLIQEIEKRACGVFLWVFLVTKLLREGLTNRDSFSDICRRLESFPTELEVFFRQILNSIEPFYHNKMSTTLQMTIAAEEPLHTMAYHFHDQEYDDEDYVLRLPIRPYSLEEDKELLEEMVWRLNSRTRGLLEMDRESGTITFLHRTVMDFLKTREMSDFLADKAPSRFNLSLSLLKVYTAMIKRDFFETQVIRQKFGRYKDCYLQFLTANALACAAEMEEPRPSDTAAYKVLEELDSIMLVKFSRKQANFNPGHPPEAFVREQLIVGQHTGFLAWKLSRQPNYFSGWGPSLIPRILADRGIHVEFDLHIPWRSRGVEMLRLALETQDLDPNESQGNIDPKRRWTPWIVLIGHTTSWSRETNKTAEERFWNLLENNILSMLLRKGADPNVTLWRSNVEGWTAFAAYLNLAFEMPSDTAREELYLRVLGDFLRAGATIDSPLTAFMNRSIQWNLGSGVRIASTSEKFFGRLKTMHAAELRACNSRLLAEVMDMLLSTVGNSNGTCMAQIRAAVEMAFPAEIFERLRTRYPALSSTQGKGVGQNGKRKRSGSTDEEGHGQDFESIIS